MAWIRDRATGLILPRHAGGLCSMLAVNQLVGFGVGGEIVPTGAQPVFDPANKGTAITLATSDRQATQGTGAGGVRSTVAIATGKYYVEGALKSLDTQRLGFCNSSYSPSGGPGSSSSWVQLSNGNKNDGSGSAYGDPVGDGDTWMLAADADAGSIWMGVNGTWGGGGDPAGGSGAMFAGRSGPFYLVWGGNSGTDGRTLTLSLVSSYLYAPPAGFLAGWGP